MVLIVFFSVLYLFLFIPIRYHEFIFSPLAAGVIYLLDRAKNGRSFKTSFKKPDSREKEWLGAGLKLVRSYPN